jgi:hypothetical protein
MTKQLEKAFSEAKKLPPKEQNRLAKRLLEDLTSEKRWARLLAKTSRKLEALEEEALAEHRRGETKLLDPDAL